MPTALITGITGQDGLYLAELLLARDFVDAAFRHAGIDDWSTRVDVDPELLRPVDPGGLTGDASRARAELGWVPTVDFDEIVGRMVDADLASNVQPEAQP
jgi:GDP-D-mannose dehydratase